MKVAVIGGGIAGVSIAYELAATAEVVLLEQEAELARHTTGRSAAKYLQTYGNDLVRALTVASRTGFDQMQAEFETAPLLKPQPLLWAAFSDAPQKVPVGGPLRELSVEEAVRMCPVLRAERLRGAAVDTSAMDIEVMALHQAYVRGLVSRGGEIRRASPVVGLQRVAGEWEVETVGASPGALVDVVVNAAGAWVDMVAAMAGARPIGIRPLRRTLFTCPVTWRQPITGWPFVADLGERFYFKAEHDHVLVSPADETPDEPGDARPLESDIAAAIEVVNAYTTLGLRSVRAAWAGLRSFVADRSPVVGARGSEPGFFWFAGQGGYGIQLAPALARAGAAVVSDRPLPPDLTALGIAADQMSPDRPALA
ncbi:MAG TPA: FAD-dependent oxidoreductase [Candidatus Solibacter sp.]|jgi:D-arginine dehydrogenase|nr:FAD-dependent oxidoreductase [Candidatus Solibacter sp.]